MPEDRLCEPIKSQEVTIRLEQAPIGGLDPKTSRGTAKERPRMSTKPRDMEETDDTYKNPKDCNALL